MTIDNIFAANFAQNLAPNFNVGGEPQTIRGVGTHQIKKCNGLLFKNKTNRYIC